MSDTGAGGEMSPTPVMDPGSFARERDERLGLGLYTSVRGSWAVISVASVVAVVLGLIRLGGPSFWVDEAFTARALDRDFLTLIERQVHVPFYAVLEPWAFLAGTSEWSLRLPAVLGAMLACALLVAVAHKVLDRRAALVSGLFLAVSPFLVKWSQQARSYTIVLAVGIGATMLLMRALERGSRGSWATYGLVFSTLVVLHPVSGLLLMPPHVVLAFQRRERILPHGLLAAVLIAALAIPWGATLAMRSIGEGVAMDWLTFPTFEVTMRALLDVSGAAGLGVVLALAGLVVLRRAGKSELAVWLATWAFAPFALALLVSTVRPIYLDRYLIVAAPAFALLAGVAVMSLGPRLRAVALVGVLIASGVGLVQWYSSGKDGNWRGEDWRSAVRTVLERRSEADATVVAPWSAAPAARYYGAEVSDVSTADSIWVLTWSETGDDLRPSERRALGFGGHRLVERQQFGWRVSAQLWRREG